ncbi:heme exporter protein CcmD [Kordiimonas lacus]|uniref:Heme exporter protein D n=1 Tax=Kordiimonas lacus TaxID=637679 RepID=A0A1G6TZY3_9PROT|nr:heme exporter protein CcmD [Kordiimonas lacus]SDD34722.1 heme exporter protein CcmD [Kordiimonas lacus]
MTDLFDMGSVGPFVIGAYGVTAVALVALAVLSLRANKAAAAEVERMRPKRRRKPDEGDS